MCLHRLLCVYVSVFVSVNVCVGVCRYADAYVCVCVRVGRVCARGCAVEARMRCTWLLTYMETADKKY